MTARAKNPGPSWGYSFISAFDRMMPEPITKVFVRMGSLVALLSMKEQRRYSRRFLAEAIGPGVSWRDSWRHFDAFARFLLHRFRVAAGATPRFRQSDQSVDRIEVLAQSGEQALFGTFHFGMSDLMGFWLSKFERSVRMVRFQVGNSDDIEWLDRRFGGKIGFIWVNKPEEMLFALKDAVNDGHSVAMKCDRVAHSSKTEVFSFLGKRRQFPFSIYHLAILFDLPVVYAFGIETDRGDIEVHSSTVYRPEGADRKEKLVAARAHFEKTLELLEGLVRQYPYQWFNFLDALPEA